MDKQYLFRLRHLARCIEPLGVGYQDFRSLLARWKLDDHLGYAEAGQRKLYSESDIIVIALIAFLEKRMGIKPFEPKILEQCIRTMDEAVSGWAEVREEKQHLDEALDVRATTFPNYCRSLRALSDAMIIGVRVRPDAHFPNRPVTPINFSDQDRGAFGSALVIFFEDFIEYCAPLNEIIEKIEGEEDLGPADD